MKRKNSDHRFRKKGLLISRIIAGFVVFAITYALTIPAITLDGQTAEEEPGIVMDNNQEAADFSESGESPQVFLTSEETAEDTVNAEETEAVSPEEPEEAVPETVSEVSETEEPEEGGAERKSSSWPASC